MALCWEQKYATGEERVDKQHKNLFEFINKLETQMQQATLDQAAVQAIIQFLATYARTHFVYEELCMHRLKCPVAQQNQNAHDKFLELFAGIQERFKREGASRALVEDVYNVATNWLVNHICKIDMKLSDVLD